MKAIDAVQKALPQKGIGKMLPIKFIRAAMLSMRRQLNVQLPPEKIFNGKIGPHEGKPEKFFLMMSQADSKTTIEPIATQDIANKY